MRLTKRVLLPILFCPLGSLLMPSASAARGAEQGVWKQFAAAADARSSTSGAISLHLEWEIPKKRILMLARLDDEQAVLYRIDSTTGLKPVDDGKRVKCHVKSDQLFCVGVGESAPSLVATGADLWSAVEAHAAGQIQKMNAYTQEAMLSQVRDHAPPPFFDLTQQLHPFEWGGEYETVENAQAFLEAVTASTRYFRSEWPQVPWLGSNGSAWVNQSDVLKFRTMKRCSTLATSERTAVHHNIDFAMPSPVTREARYLWQQPIDWQSVEGFELDSEGVFMHGSYAGRFEGQGLTYLTGWNPRGITINASKFDPSKYSVALWNLHLLLPDEGGLRERVTFAVTYLNLVCGKG